LETISDVTGAIIPVSGSKCQSLLVHCLCYLYAHCDDEVSTTTR